MTTEETNLDNLRSVPRRNKIHDASINVKIPHEVKTVLEGIAATESVTASTVVRWAIADYLKGREGEL